MNNSERVFLSKLKKDEIWGITNLSWNWATEAMSNILQNYCNEYVEYYNCGVQYRMIRREDIKKYGIELQTKEGECIYEGKDTEQYNAKVQWTPPLK